jgi:eukaryotic-like serine/threonine-protein kinase
MTVPVSPGDVIDGRYVIERLLGEGGMGAVFIAREERLGRRVAIKVLLNAVASNPEAVVRFEREARSAAVLQSDHVTRVLSVGHIANGAPYIVMELLDGADLAATLVQRGPLPPHEVIGYMIPVCEALAEAHALGIVHRDLKPANVFLSRRPGGGTRVKVLDFGISKSATGTASSSLTATTALMGTPLYMSPEQLREARNVDGRADIWALGVMIYELLSGRPPFLSDALAELCVFIMTTAHVPLSTHRPDIPPELDAIVNRCLQKDPAARFATVDILMAALAAVPPAGSAPRAAPPPPAPVATPHVSPSAGLPTEAVGARSPAPAPAPWQEHAPPHVPPPQAPPREPSHLAPPGVLAGTADPVSTTAGWAPPARPSILGLALVFAGALVVGGIALYVLVLRPAPEPVDAPAAASGAAVEVADAAPAARASTSSEAAASAPLAISSTTPDASQAIIVPKPLAPTVILPAAPLAPPGGGPAVLPPPLVPPPAVVKTVPSARVTTSAAPSAKPPVLPPPNPGSLMPKGRND